MSTPPNGRFRPPPPTPSLFGNFPPEAYLIDANAGCNVARRGDRFVATPRYPEEPEQRHEPFALPPLPGGRFDRLTKLLRAVWRLRHACATWMLYVHLTERRWHPYLPPQWCEPDGSLANLSYPRVTVPGPDLRLCGTYTCNPTTDAALLEAQLPPRDGLHLVWHPGNWANVTAFVTAAGQAVPLAVEACVADEPEPTEAELRQRLWIVTQA